MISMPPAPVLFFLSVVLAAVVFLVAAEGAGAELCVVSTAGVDISCCLVAAELAWFRRKVVEETPLLQYILVKMRYVLVRMRSC